MDLLELLKSKTLTTPNAESGESTVDGNAKWYIHFERQFGSCLQKQYI